jgi:PAS domain S-box-containing protein
MMGIVELSNDDIVHISANQASVNFFGHTSDDLKGLPASQDGRSPEFQQLWIDQYRQSEQLGQPVQFEYAHETPTGIAWLSSTVCPVYHEPNARSRFSYIVENITERKTAEIRIESSLHEKETLLKEIHHRVKNNLQIICSLLGLQSQFSKDDLSINIALMESQNRIQSMALVHETLYRSPTLSTINMQEYIQKLAHSLSRSYWCVSAQVQLSTQISPEVVLDLNTAISLGLIINELVSNAFKHAFTDQATGHVEIQLFPKADHQTCLKIQDNGQGLPPHFDLTQSQTLGLTLVSDLINQIDGTLTVTNQPGATFTLIFPVV